MLALSACWPLAGGEVSHRASVLNTCTDERFRGRGKILRISIIVARAYQECALTAWEGRPTAFEANMDRPVALLVGQGPTDLQWAACKNSFAS